MGKKILIEDLVCEIDAEQRKGPDLDLAKIVQRAEQEMERQRLLKKRRGTQLAVAAAVLMAVLLVSFSPLSLEEGYGDHFRRLFLRLDADESQTQIDNLIEGENKDAYRRETMTLKEVRKSIPFDVFLPEYMPAGYALGEIEATYCFEELTKIVITYTDYDSLEEIKYTIAPLEHKKTRTDHIDIEECELKVVLNKGIEYRYTTNKTGNIIFWDYDEHFYKLEGNLTSEGLIGIAFSIDYKGDKE